MIKIRLFGKALFAIGKDYLYLPILETTFFTRSFAEREGGDFDLVIKHLKQGFTIRQYKNLCIAIRGRDGI